MNKIYQKLLSDIHDFGIESQPRDLKVKELFLKQLNFDPSSVLVNFSARPFNFKYLAGELAWYLSKETSTNFIKNFSSAWDKLKNPDGSINSNYGTLLFGKQLQWVKDSLLNDKDSRQAIAFLNQPKFQYKHNKDFVCSVYLNFWIRNDVLNMKLSIRSNDAIYGLTYDAPYFSFVHQQVYFWLKRKYTNLKLGTYYHFADNIHYYEQHNNLVEKILNEDVSLTKEYKFKLKTSVFELKDNNMTYTEDGIKFMNNIEYLIDNNIKKPEEYKKSLEIIFDMS